MNTVSGTMHPDDDVLAVQARGGEGEAIVLLIRRYLPVIKSQIRSFYLSRIDYDDLLQEGMVGLLKAIRSFDEQKASFRSFAHTCISNQISSAVRTAFNRKNAPLSESLPWEEQLEPVLDRGPEDILIDRENLRATRELLLAHLSKLEVQVLELYVDGYSYAEIASYLLKPVKSVDNAVQRIRRKLIHSLKN